MRLSKEIYLKNLAILSFKKKISQLLEEIKTNPYSGTGHPERLKGYEIPTFSRKIDKKNRLIYTIPPGEQVIEILSIWGHYDDK